MRKILGILNITAGVTILALEIWLWAHGNVSVDFRNPIHIKELACLLLILATSLASGILVLNRRGKILVILASVNFMFAGFALFFQLFTVLLALFD